MERIKGVWKENGQTYRTRIFASNFEINTENGISHEVCYISSPSGLAAMHVTEIPLSGGAGVGNLFYTYNDHLGSIISVTNSTGTVIARQNFDAWGRRRHAIDYSYLPNNTKTIHNGLASLNAANPNLPAWLFRGYTGHEMLDEFALINMNARLYDPVVGMMLSCDNYVTDPTNTQCYNRYNYCYNNPLKYTDPDGNWAGWDDVAVMGAGFGYGYASYGIKNGEWGCNALLNGIMYAGLFELGYLTGGGGLAAGANMSTAGSFLFGQALNIAVAAYVPPVTVYESENFNLSVSPMVGYGSSGLTLGISAEASGTIGNAYYNIGAGIGYNEGMSDLSGNASGSVYKNWSISGGGYGRNGNQWGASYGKNYFTGGNNNQKVAVVGLQLGRLGIRIDEDFRLGKIGGDGDRYRTGGGLLTYKINKDYTAAFGLSMITGEQTGTLEDDNVRLGPNGTYDPDCELGRNRAGIIYGGFIYKNKAYLGGVNSEKVLHKVQNSIHNVTGDPYFYDFNYKSKAYGFSGNYNNNYLNY